MKLPIATLFFEQDLPETSMKRKPKQKLNPKVDQVYKAIQAYVEKNGGKLVVIGGISIQEWPHDSAGIFHVAVQCLGKKPHFKGEVVKRHPIT